MCFSASASFVGGAVISSIGVASIRKNREPSQRLFSGIPILFGVQQISEGIVWTALQDQSYEGFLKAGAYFFLAIALVIWPVVMPLAVLLMEKARKVVHFVFLATGILVSATYLIIMLTCEISAKVSSFHILYIVDCPPEILETALIFYIIATIPPLLISSRKGVHLFGIVVALSYFVSWILFGEYLISVWCFFAALASVIIWFIVADRRERTEASL